MNNNIDHEDHAYLQVNETEDVRSKIEQLIKESIVEASMRELELLGKIDRILKTTEDQEIEAYTHPPVRLGEGQKEVLRGKIVFGNLILDENRKVAQCGGSALCLTRTEYLLLKYLVIHKEETVSREALLKDVWGYRQTIATRATDDMIKRVRKKLKEQGATVQIKTLRGVGFFIEEF